MYVDHYVITYKVLFSIYDKEAKLPMSLIMSN
jgi:hypothetical protein